MLAIDAWPFWLVIVGFGFGALVIGFAGTWMSRIADRLADLTGLGEAIFGAVFLGASTSLPGIITSVGSAWVGHPDLAISNAIGGIAAQTVFLAVADIVYRRANLEHAAASIQNMVQGTLLIVLITLPVLMLSAPNVEFFAVHPGSIAILLAYGYGIHIIHEVQQEPMWHAHQTAETRQDEPDREVSEDGPGLNSTWIIFAGLAVALAASGLLVTHTGIAIAERSGLTETVVGVLGTAIVTSLPELVTSVAAVRQGALTLAVGGVIGGNCFDVLFLAFSDFAYRRGSLYMQLADRHVFIITITIVLTAVLLMGMLRREKRGPGNIGFESLLVLLLYLGGVMVLIQL